MKCQNCNAENDDAVIFCKNCGERLVQQSTKFTKKNDQENKEEKKNSAEKVISKNTSDKQTYAGRAWSEIRQSEGWIKKLLLVGLANIIPILNFAPTGYALNWGVEAAKGERNQLKTGIFEGDSFKYGFFEFLTWLVFGIVFGVACSILSSILGHVLIIGAILWIAFIVGEILYNAFTSLAAMRMAINGSMGGSFELKELWMSYKKDFGKVVIAYFLPALFCNLIAFGFSAIVICVFATGQIGSIFNLISNYQYIFTSTQTMLYALQLVGSIAFCATLCYVGVGFIAGIEKVIRYRAIGHYIATTSPEWCK